MISVASAACTRACATLRCGPSEVKSLLGEGDELRVARRTRGHEAVLEHPGGGEREPARVTGVARRGCGAAQHSRCRGLPECRSISPSLMARSIRSVGSGGPSRFRQVMRSLVVLSCLSGRERHSATNPARCACSIAWRASRRRRGDAGVTSELGDPARVVGALQCVGDGAVQSQSACRGERVVAGSSEQSVCEGEVRRARPGSAAMRPARIRSGRGIRDIRRATGRRRWRAGRRRTRCRSPRRGRAAPGPRHRGARSGEPGSPC